MTKPLSTNGKVPVAAPVEGLRTRLAEAFWVRLTTSWKLDPLATENSPVGFPPWGSTDHSSAPPGENLSTAWP